MIFIDFGAPILGNLPILMLYNVGKTIWTIMNYPPVITIFIGGMFTIPKWVVYGIALFKPKPPTDPPWPRNHLSRMALQGLMRLP